MPGFFKPFKSWTQPLDRVAISLMVGLWLVLGLLVIWGDRTQPQVRSFNWAEQLVGAEDTAFILSFNRVMDWNSVAQNLKLSPSLPGKASWTGRRFVYTLTQPIPYGQSFQLSLGQATSKQNVTMAPFRTTFKSRDLAFVYVGVNGDEAGRLILSNLTQNRKTILTPDTLTVLNFKIYPKGDRILFTATERGTQASDIEAKLYTTTTGLDGTEVGKVDLILDNPDHQILKFDLSANGDRIVVQRAARQNATEAGLWQLPGTGGSPEKIKVENAGDFLIDPNGQVLVAAQGKGLALIPLNTQTEVEPFLDFLPQYGMVLNFSLDGTAATMVKFNTDYTRSLFLVSTQGNPKELLRINGSILSAAFTAQRDAVYALLTRTLPGKDYREQPFIAKIDLKTGKVQELLTLPLQRNITFSLAPDGSQLLFDQPMDASASPSGALAPSNIWSLSLPVNPATQPAVIAVGSKPQWLR